MNLQLKLAPFLLLSVSTMAAFNLDTGNAPSK